MYIKLTAKEEKLFENSRTNQVTLINVSIVQETTANSKILKQNSSEIVEKCKKNFHG